MKTHELLSKYVERKKSQYGVSLRSLAGQLEVSPSFLSRILSGKKPVPYALLLKMKTVLDIDPESFEQIRAAHVDFELEGQVPSRGHRDVSTELESWSLSEAQSLKVLRNWHYLPILEYTSLSRFDGTSQDIASSLGLAHETVEVALRELVSLGLLDRKEDGKLRKTKAKLRWSSAKAVREIGAFHKAMMQKACESLTNKQQSEYERRLITGVTLTLPLHKVKQAKSRINEFINELANELIEEEDLSSEVYHLATQFFPISKR